jgi:hypothetical protein
MKKLISVMFLLAGLTFVHAADKYAPAGTVYNLRVFTMSSAHGSSTVLKTVRDMKSDFTLTAQS